MGTSSLAPALARRGLTPTQLRRPVVCTFCSGNARPLATTATWYAAAKGTAPPSAAAASSESEVRALVSKRDYPSYLAHYFYPRSRQRHFLAIRAFNAELASIKETVSSEILGRIRIGWWRDAIRGCYNKRPPKHPVALALADAIHDPEIVAHGGLVQDHFERIITAREDDLGAPLTPPTLEDMEGYSEATSSRLNYLSLNLLGVDSRPADEVFAHLGKASGFALQLASVPFHAGFVAQAQAPGQTPGQGPQAPHGSGSMARGQRRLVLPHEYVLEHHVIEEDVYRNGGNARGLKDAVFATATRANDYLISARTLIRDAFPKGRVPAALTGPLVGAVPTRFYLEQLEAHDFDPFHPALHAVAAGRGWKLAWAVWRASRKGNI